MIWNNIAFPVKEEWKDIQDFEGKYQISNYGRVKSLKRDVHWTGKNGQQGVKRVGERILKPKIDKDGYEAILLSSLDLGRVNYRSHRLVALHFLEKHPTNESNIVVDHIDNVKNNNMWFNLQWVTQEVNTIKYYAKDYGKTKPLSSLSTCEWVYIKFLFNSGVSYQGICDNLGLTVSSPYTLREVFSGRKLASITGFKKNDFSKRKDIKNKIKS